MWAIGRYTFGLSEKEFWSMSPGMWSALHAEHAEELKVFDAFQARITTAVASTIPRKGKKRIKENDFRFFPEKVVGNKKKNKGAQLLGKMRSFALALGMEVRGDDG